MISALIQQAGDAWPTSKGVNLYVTELLIPCILCYLPPKKVVLKDLGIARLKLKKY